MRNIKNCRKCDGDWTGYKVVWIKESNMLSVTCTCGYFWEIHPFDHEDAEAAKKGTARPRERYEIHPD